MKHITLTADIFDQTFDVYVSSPGAFTKAAYKEYRENLEPNINALGEFFSFVNSDQGMRYVIWLNDYKPSPEYIEVLSHELIHLCVRFMLDRGLEPISLDNSELLAYLHGYLLRTAMEKLQQ